MGDSKHSADYEDCFDEEDPRGDFISYMDTADAKGVPSSHRGVGLDLSFAAADKKGAESAPSGVQEENVVVVFELPDGSQGESTFRMGQTVEFVKSYVESEYGIPMCNQTLLLDGRPMMDPLSLLDFPGAKGTVILNSSLPISPFYFFFFFLSFYNWIRYG